MRRPKPEWNKFDNIWEIRQTYKLAKQEVLTILGGKRPYCRELPVHLGRALIFRHVEGFIFAVSQQKKFELPVWKILCPDLEQRDKGAIYYVVRAPIGNFVFRGTYGYRGVGPHQSALVETYFHEILGASFAVRDADYFITLALE